MKTTLLTILFLFVALSVFAGEVVIYDYYTLPPDSAGGVGFFLKMRNESGKVIKYLKLYVVPYNAVHDVQSSEIDGESGKWLSVTGPIYDGGAKYEWGPVWYNYTIKYAIIEKAIAIYMDNTEEELVSVSTRSTLVPKVDTEK